MTLFHMTIRCLSCLLRTTMAAVRYPNQDGGYSETVIVEQGCNLFTTNRRYICVTHSLQQMKTAALVFFKTNKVSDTVRFL